MINLKIDSVFIFSQSNKKYFYAKFEDKLNIIYGRNTSGKSTLIQLILYTFGINEDTKSRLRNILSENIFIRLDCTLTNGNSISNIVFIREDNSLLIKLDAKPVEGFYGVNADNSQEHIKLKDFYRKLFNFNLSLLKTNSDELSNAPIEAAFLPYYVAQSFGWVYLRKSFSGLEFYRNFKEDYLDYYLGIENPADRMEKYKLEQELKAINGQLDFYKGIEESNISLHVAILTDDDTPEQAFKYIDDFATKQTQRLNLDTKYIQVCNEIEFIKQRLSVLRRIEKSHKDQSPIDGKCPACEQNMPLSIETVYKHFQELNDTESQLVSLRNERKILTSKKNSLETKIKDLDGQIERANIAFQQANTEGVTIKNWIEGKVSRSLVHTISSKMSTYTDEKVSIGTKLKSFKSTQDIDTLRSQFGKKFNAIFIPFIREMGLSPEDIDHSSDLYKLNGFPFQGVELLKAVMCYHFAFNKIIKETSYIHRLPFILDAVFKEDVEDGSKEQILKFIATNMPQDTQTVISIADEQSKSKILEYNRRYFNGSANLIYIGNNQQKSMLKPYSGEYDELLAETMELLT